MSSSTSSKLHIIDILLSIYNFCHYLHHQSSFVRQSHLTLDFAVPMAGNAERQCRKALAWMHYYEQNVKKLQSNSANFQLRKCILKCPQNSGHFVNQLTKKLHCRKGQLGKVLLFSILCTNTGLILGLCPANERHPYKVTPSSQPCNTLTNDKLVK